MENVREGSRSAMTLAVLAVIFLASVVWGWSNATQPLPERVKAAACTETLIKKGDKVAPPQVRVNVLNAGGPNGLASKTRAKLADAGFVTGSAGNAPVGTRAGTAQIWSDDPANPAVQLLASYLGKKVKVVDQPSGYAGITIVVGKRFKGVTKGKAAVRADKDSFVCTPPLSSVPEEPI
ncbi:LytR C-terminal domain-containing protein [Nocardioides sp. zg-536]|uniref:LytR C-terminal domain-containing protein n=1 Tax=Nocardioides faecalis TaxID=2803858 RepID=A0A938Y5H3_9ACTN|nr:LytR C-terminal domain-containing protein [Nocardioides faecalis]MBM9458618.1 LytR C-terminal domain-containing protein [Nocardioides faecalis]MBS4752950.1 LytR C-terminal domain-containing protein [Nocardioides faecalis]QVI58616.1 LytR C-terminal domain-containing protein [Nocardioides faecalis]